MLGCHDAGSQYQVCDVIIFAGQLAQSGTYLLIVFGGSWQDLPPRVLCLL